MMSSHWIEGCERGPLKEDEVREVAWILYCKTHQVQTRGWGMGFKDQTSFGGVIYKYRPLEEERKRTGDERASSCFRS